ncbi:methionine adenosyltransferase [Enterococcus sp. DIV0869a]|uniref:S-adenosylmethionine synthase n=2 Tax=Candidatus Enterococcus ikei TaxID=2815326 RepID=A0ABS3GW26_9ENTE|nr:methionine adenosyltransferase [Enterococcus sp. DIV0869a]MBO0439025.1 methionine adenosyltransferase [Enterococcus sp. DIV0869a]
MEETYFTSESVTEGHPDKIADQISDAILDAVLEQDSNGRVACEVAVTTGLVLIFGEITTNANVNYRNVARETIKSIGYSENLLGFNGDSCAILVALDEQSPDIAQGLTNENNDKLGAGDQGMMFGFATNETPEYLPLPIALSHRIAKRLSIVRKENILDYLKPDGKCQVTVEYDSNGEAKRIEAIVVSTQHSEDVNKTVMEQDMIKHVINPVIPNGLLDENTKFYINPSGKFVTGGPQGDAGLTGRKIIVDTYGGFSSHGGGAFSGKDATKVDRSGAYMARYIAKNIVASGLAKKCEIQLAYAIGLETPISVVLNTFGTAEAIEEIIAEAVKMNFDLTPRGIIKQLHLDQPVFSETATYGHFGNNKYTWEQVDQQEKLKKTVESLLLLSSQKNYYKIK